MKRNFTILSLLLFGFFTLNCRTADAPEANANQTVIAAAPTPTANENTAVAAKTPEEVPIFTDANEAAAAGDKYLDAVETENAINAFRQAVKLDADFGDAYFKLGIAYALREKEDKDAGTIRDEPTPAPAKKSKKAKKDVAPPLTESGKAFENAAKIYEKVLKKNPKDDEALYNLGRADNKLNKDTEAEKALRQAVKLKPDNIEYEIEFGAILMKLAKYDEAVTVLNKAVKLDDSNLQAQDLLEKADAGKKRINFGIQPKPQQQQQPPHEAVPHPKPPKAKPSPSASPSVQPTPKAAPTK